MQRKGLNKEELRRNSIFLLTDDSQDRDFEFFIFVDDPDNRSEFLQELHYCLCKCNWISGQPECSFAVEGHKKELQEWLSCDRIEDETLINPLSWLKIAIERYPYRLFIVFDKKDWKANECSPVDSNFWFPKKNRPDNPSEWVRSSFLYKRICWIEEEVTGVLDSPKLKEKVYSTWASHLANRINTIPEKHILLHVQTSGRPDDPNIHIPASFPDSCFENEGSRNLPQGNADLVKLVNAPQRDIIFLRHGSLEDLWRDQKNPENGIRWKDIKYFEGISGSQFQFPLLNKHLNLLEKTEALQTCLLSLSILDERYQEWEETLPHETKEQLLYTHIFPVQITEAEKFTTLGNNLQILIHREFLEPEDDHRYLPEFIKGKNGSPPDILVIHQGIIDKIKSINIIQMKELVPYVLITSGRGSPPNIPNGVKFLPFSMIQFFLMSKYYEKFLFMKALMSI